jgi:hypothetical protein
MLLVKQLNYINFSVHDKCMKKVFYKKKKSRKIIKKPYICINIYI